MSDPTIDDDARAKCAIHLLDVGPKEYGDAVLCQFGEISVLIDGAHTGDQTAREGHPSIPEQLGRLLGQAEPPYSISLLVISHAHEDHIGCIPHLVEKDLLRADWALLSDPLLGWGRGLDEPVKDVHTDDRVRQVAAGLREEVRTSGTDSASLTQFLSDAANLEERYKAMIQTLAERGTRVVRYGRDSHARLVSAFSEVGLKIIGPSRDQLAICAERIARASDASVQDAVEVFQSDAAVSPDIAYRRLVAGSAADAADATSRPGPAVNLQSIVLSFDYQGHKFLFAGDMQFAEPQMKALEEEVLELRRKVKADAPYSFVKLSHHGSDNAFDEEILGELKGTELFGICAGAKSTAHPHPTTLSALDARSSEIKWVRTDRNGLTTLLFKARRKPEITVSKGEVNDPRPNSVDEVAAPPRREEPTRQPAPQPAPPEEAPPPAAETVVRPMVETHVTPSSSFVEVIAKIPHLSTRVTITIDVEPRGAQPPPQPSIDTTNASRARPSRPLPQLKVDAARGLSELLFVTSGQGLAKNIGEAECEHLFASINSHGLRLYTHLPPDPKGSARSSAMVRELLAEHQGAKGVVLLGGHDILPSQAVDCLPPSLRRRVDSGTDADNYIVWSDDVYGDRDGDGLPELPVSRIPDGLSSELVFAAIQASPRRGQHPRAGVRNVRRPFADGIYETLPHGAEMLVSSPFTTDHDAADPLGAERVYLMLHGDFTDTSRFWGEETPHNMEAINLSNIKRADGAVVFTGCCWGALTVTTPAGRLKPGGVVGQRTPSDSIALSFLQKGALAFLGCTGAHYSPLDPPYNFFGGPFHKAFWSLYGSGKSPARSLFEAKLQYIRELPHGRNTPTSQAIEYKIFRQYTCLGLGW